MGIDAAIIVTAVSAEPHITSREPKSGLHLLSDSWLPQDDSSETWGQRRRLNAPNQPGYSQVKSPPAKVEIYAHLTNAVTPALSQTQSASCRDLRGLVLP